MKITKGLDCLNDNLDGNSIAVGMVFYIPSEHKVILEHDRTNRARELSKLPHVIMCKHYQNMSLNVPGGKIEKGETIVEGVNREFNEEVIGKPVYLLEGKPVFDESHFKFKKEGESEHNVYTFVRIIRSKLLYKKLVYDMKMASLGLFDSDSDWISTDTFGGVSVPIFMEKNETNKIEDTVGFPGLLQNIAYLHRSTLVLSLLMEEDSKECVLTKEGKVDFLSKKYSYPGIPICSF